MADRPRFCARCDSGAPNRCPPPPRCVVGSRTARRCSRIDAGNRTAVVSAAEIRRAADAAAVEGAEARATGRSIASGVVRWRAFEQGRGGRWRRGRCRRRRRSRARGGRRRRIRHAAVVDAAAAGPAFSAFDRNAAAVVDGAALGAELGAVLRLAADAELVGRVEAHAELRRAALVDVAARAGRLAAGIGLRCRRKQERREQGSEDTAPEAKSRSWIDSIEAKPSGGCHRIQDHSQKSLESFHVGLLELLRGFGTRSGMLERYTRGAAPPLKGS
jgi:hypothetical protein